MSLCAAIDLHFNNNVLSVLDEADQVVRLKRLPNDLPTVLSELAPHRDQLAWRRRRQEPVGRWTAARSRL